MGRPLAEFLRDRRESLTPEQVGLPREPRRRVRGLRRTEVADLAGISSDYYLRLEQGRGHQPSRQVLSALGRALLLDGPGEEYLHRIADLSGDAPTSSEGDLPDGVATLVELYADTPAYALNGTLDVVAVNAPGRLLAPDQLRVGFNLLVSVFEHFPEPHSEPHWRRTAETLAAALRYYADPRSPRLRALVDGLSASDPRFAAIWSRCEIRPHRSSWPMVHIEPHGWVSLRSETLAVPGTSGYTVTVFFAEPRTPGVAALRDLVARARAEEGVDAEPLASIPIVP
ncbi:helix-turn-helix transcriptional regulator [Microbacterium sp. B19]|uniref:helix-turn-helix transcriptional regulator n=1 Tax=Microbacterium sp. B19 TaxID=96765 RepID=UPI000687F23C|nr:helix-turn-helix transcriptional regulator [Microbacterium sp. B19]